MHPVGSEAPVGRYGAAMPRRKQGVPLLARKHSRHNGRTQRWTRQGGVAAAAVRHSCRSDCSGGCPELQEGSGLGVVAFAQGKQIVWKPVLTRTV
jgi:hypothetical protein